MGASTYDSDSSLETTASTEPPPAAETASDTIPAAEPQEDAAPDTQREVPGEASKAGEA